MKRKSAILVVVVTALLSVGVLAGRAWGAGGPSSGPTGNGSLWYSGELSTAAGAAVTGTHTITITLWDDPADGAALHQMCMTTQAVSVAAGHFRLALDRDDNTCALAVHNHPNLWLQVQVDTDPALPRTQLGAVPYALEADHAVNAAAADTATNATHADVAAQVTRARSGGMPIGAAGTVCGFTASATTGNVVMGSLTGAVATRALCQAATGCTSTAHMCTTSEAAISRQLGPLTIPGGRAWVTGVYGSEPAGLVNDCASASPYHAWTSALHTAIGATTDSDAPTDEYCDVAHRIACCD